MENNKTYKNLDVKLVDGTVEDKGGYTGQMQRPKPLRAPEPMSD